MSTENSVPRKGMSRAKTGWIIAASAVIVLVSAVLVYAFVITNTGQWLLAKFQPDTEEQKISYASASETTEVIADEGFVLLKNEGGLLPLATSADAKAPLSLFGMRSVQLVYNAGGSSASNVDRAVRMEDALAGENGNFAVNEDLLNLYYHYYTDGSTSIAPTDAPANYSASEIVDESGQNVQNITVPELPVEVLNDTTVYDDGRSVLDHAADYSDTALITVGRGAGEMYDFTVDGLQLSDDEAAMVDAVATAFDDVILVINAANAMDIDFIDDYPSIKSVIWIGYPGEAGIESLARILSGEVNPSGHLPDTWMRDNTAVPAANNYIEYEEDGVRAADSFKYANTPAETGYFVHYAEGIYVGYRYLETRHDTDESFDYDSVVMYPFGSGLSYTEFEQQILDLSVEGETVSVRVAVRNAGEVAGKDVIQVYSTPPYTGAIEKSTVNLVAFDKTNLIEPGETQRYTIDIPLEDFASFDEREADAYVLEAGDYGVSVRENSHVVLDQAGFEIGAQVTYDEANPRSTDATAASSLFEDALGVDDYLTRDWDADARAFTGPQEADFTAPQEVLDAIAGWTAPTDAELGLTEADLPATGEDNGIDFADMVGVPSDDPMWDEFVAQLTLEEMTNIAGNGQWQIQGVERLGVPRTLTPDGSTTIGASIYSGPIMGADGKGITYPIPQVIAATWNPDIATVMGTSVGAEAQANGYAGWYAPAMNTHRTAFNGRNFEYYSEDPVLAGTTAAGVIRGATEAGVITFMKHFALNDRESNTRSQLFTWTNEQAAREIYLKPFELAVKEGGSLAAMSSFNYLGATWTGGNRALLTDLLRDEWGFEGFVITDAGIYPFMNPVQAAYAGGNVSLDVMAAWTGGQNHSAVLLEAATHPDTRIAMTRNLSEGTKDVLFAVAQTWPVSQG